MRLGRRPPPAGVRLYELLVLELEPLGLVEQMALANALRRGAPWDDLEEWQRQLLERVAEGFGS